MINLKHFTHNSKSPSTSISRSTTSAIGGKNPNINDGLMTQSFTYQQGITPTTILPVGIVPAAEVQQRISIYSKEPRRLGQISIQKATLNGAQINTSVNVHKQKRMPEVIQLNEKLSNLMPTTNDQINNTKLLQQQTLFNTQKKNKQSPLKTLISQTSSINK